MASADGRLPSASPSCRGKSSGRSVEDQRDVLAQHMSAARGASGSFVRGARGDPALGGVASRSRWREAADVGSRAVVQRLDGAPQRIRTGCGSRNLLAL